MCVDQAAGATAPAALRISAETAPAGGWAQIKIYAAKPMAIASGHLVLNLDATVFGAGASTGLFGANGDANGVAAATTTATGQQLDVQFSSATGGIGQLAGVPVLVVSVPVLASAAGRTVAVTATSPDSSVAVTSGSVTVNGTLSVEKIPAGMGVAPAGTVVPVSGTGFTSSTTVTIDGVALAAVRFVSARQIEVTLGGAAELVGKLARVTDSGTEFDYYCFQPDDPVNFPETTAYGSVVASVQPLFPLFASTGFSANISYLSGVMEVQNPNSAAATVSVANLSYCCGPSTVVSQTTLSIPAGSWAIFDGTAHTSFAVTSTLPVRAVALGFCGATVELPVCLKTPVPTDSSVVVGSSPPALAPAALVLAWQRGTPVPAARKVWIGATSTGAAATARTASGGAWLAVADPVNATPYYTAAVTVNPSQLAAGTYRGSIEVALNYALTQGPVAALPVTLTVTDAAVPAIAAAPASLSFTAPAFDATPYSQTIAVTSDSGPAAFSVTPQPGTWLKVSPLSGTTPATLTVTWDPAVTPQIHYQQRSTSASIVIDGPGNTIAVAAAFNVTGVQTFQTFLGTSGLGPNGLVFPAQTGSASQTQTIDVDPAGVITAVVDRPWMSAVAPDTGTGAGQTVLVTVNPAGLAAGVYHGTVTLGEAGLAAIAVPVTLSVWSDAPPLTISSGSFTFRMAAGGAAPANQTAVVESGGVPIAFTTLAGADWLNVVDHYTAPTPASLLVGVINAPGSPGQYDGSFTLQSPGHSVYVPVTLLVEPGPVAQPVLSQVVNAASGIAGGVSPGEILSVRGYATGAAAVGGLQFDAAGLVASKGNGLQVTFDGRAAPLIYTSANQTNVIVPYEVAGKASTAMQVVYEAAAGTVQTAAWVLPVVGSAPGVFTMDATGTGPAAVLNQDGSVNSATNPAAGGSVISIFATGEGQTLPAGVTGSVTQSITTVPVLPVTVTVGGVASTVQYAGPAPGEVAGVLQVNAVVPPGIAPGTAVAVTVSAGGVASQAGVTIAVN